MRYYEDPILGKGRAADVSGGTGSADYVGGARIAIGGETISFVNSADIVNVTGTSVTLQPDTAYKIYATSQAITLNANPPAAGKWAYEGHLEIFTAGTGYIVTGANVVLANALEPDAVNNCTVRFHDGLAIIDVEDHVAGYIVVNGSTSGDGSLYYGITTSTNDYVAFDASLNGTPIPLAGATAEGEKHLVGNGYTSTTLTGAVNCGTSKFTVANLSLQDVVVGGGVMTLGDVYIPSGSTVAVSGGGLAVEKVTGAGSESVIDLGGTNLSMLGGYVSGLTVTNGSATGNNEGGLFYTGSGSFTLNNCELVSGTAYAGGAIGLRYGRGATVTSCAFAGNTATKGNAIALSESSFLNLSGCSFGSGQDICFRGGTPSVTLYGTNVIDSINANGGTGSVVISSGAILDLTGNTNTTPIAPGGGIVFEAGGATVLYSSGAVSGSYMMDNVTLPAGAKLTNTAVVDLGGGDGSCYGSASGIAITSGDLRVSSGGTADNTTVNSRGRLIISSGGTVNRTTVNGYGTLYVSSGGVANSTTVNEQWGYLVVLSGGTATEPIISSGGILTVSSGGTALLVTSNTGANVTVAEGGVITYKE